MNFGWTEAAGDPPKTQTKHTELNQGFKSGVTMCSIAKASQRFAVKDSREEFRAGGGGGGPHKSQDSKPLCSRWERGPGN